MPVFETGIVVSPHNSLLEKWLQLMDAYKPEFLYLMTTGWKSGSAREIEIWYVPHGDCYYLCAEHFEETHWVKNIRHNPAISFWVNSQRYEGQGRALDSTADAELIKAVSLLFDQKYEWSDGLLVELCPNRT